MNRRPHEHSELPLGRVSLDRDFRKDADGCTGDDRALISSDPQNRRMFEAENV